MALIKNTGTYTVGPAVLKKKKKSGEVYYDGDVGEGLQTTPENHCR